MLINLACGMKLKSCKESFPILEYRENFTTMMVEDDLVHYQCKLANLQFA